MIQPPPGPAISEEQLRDAHRELSEPISFEVMAQSPALLICLRNMAEIRAGTRANAAIAKAALLRKPHRPATPKKASVQTRSGKMAAANDLDND